MLFLEQSETQGTLSGEVTEGKEKENVSPASVGEKTTEKGEFLLFALMLQMFKCSYIIGLHMFRNPHIHVLSGSAERAILKQEKEVCGTNLVELVKRRVEPCKTYDK